MRVQQIRMAFEARRRIGGDFALRLQPLAERVHVLGETMIAFAPEPDVQEISLRKHQP